MKILFPWLCAFFVWLPAVAALPPPEPPATYVLDSTARMDPETRQDLEEILDAFTRAKGHRVYVWILNQVPERGLSSLTKEALAAWHKPAEAGEKYGTAMLALLPPQGRADLQISEELEEALPLEERQQLVASIEQRLQNDGNAPAIRAGALEVLNGILGPQPKTPTQRGMAPEDLKLLLIVLGVLVGLVFLIILLGGEITISSRDRVVYRRKFSGKYADITLSILQVLLVGIGLGSKAGYRAGGGKFGGGGASGSW